MQIDVFGAGSHNRHRRADFEQISRLQAQGHQLDHAVPVQQRYQDAVHDNGDQRAGNPVLGP
ncbi:hypothetical protein D3C73_1633330 [compost metagenome]